MTVPARRRAKTALGFMAWRVRVGCDSRGCWVAGVLAALLFGGGGLGSRVAGVDEASLDRHRGRGAFLGFVEGDLGAADDEADLGNSYRHGHRGALLDGGDGYVEAQPESVLQPFARLEGAHGQLRQAGPGRQTGGEVRLGDTMDTAGQFRAVYSVKVRESVGVTSNHGDIGTELQPPLG